MAGGGGASSGSGPGGPLRRRDALHAWTLHFGPNMTPMVDVVLVILIFFMAATVFIGPEWFLRASLPAPERGAGGGAPGTTAPADPMELPPVQIRIALVVAEDGRTLAVGLGAQDLPIDAMLSRLGVLASGTAVEKISVLLTPSPAVPYEEVVRVHEGCVALGIGSVGIAVAPGGPGEIELIEPGG